MKHQYPTILVLISQSEKTTIVGKLAYCLFLPTLTLCTLSILSTLYMKKKRLTQYDRCKLEGLVDGFTLDKPQHLKYHFPLKRWGEILGVSDETIRRELHRGRWIQGAPAKPYYKYCANHANDDAKLKQLCKGRQSIYEENLMKYKAAHQALKKNPCDAYSKSLFDRIKLHSFCKFVGSFVKRTKESNENYAIRNLLSRQVV